jgi:hypothetical protein
MNVGLTAAQAQLFRTWWRDTIHQGTAWFRMPLMFRRSQMSDLRHRDIEAVYDADPLFWTALDTDIISTPSGATLTIDSTRGLRAFETTGGQPDTLRFLLGDEIPARSTVRVRAEMTGDLNNEQHFELRQGSAGTSFDLGNTTTGGGTAGVAFTAEQRIEDELDTLGLYIKADTGENYVKRLRVECLDAHPARFTGPPVYNNTAPDWCVVVMPLEVRL